MKIKTAIPTVVLSGALLATIGLTSSAAPAPEPARDATAYIPNAKGAVTNWHLGKGTVYGDNLGPGMVSWFTTVYNGSVHEIGLDANLKAKVNDKTGTVSGVEGDAPYPGSTKLQDLGKDGDQGSNSTEKVPGDAGAASHTVWVKCAPGKIAVGGGFQLAADASLAAKKAVQVVTSQATGAAIKDDPAGSLLPTGWEVEVINNGTEAITVRPYVTCLKLG